VNIGEPKEGAFGNRLVHSGKRFMSWETHERLSLCEQLVNLGTPKKNILRKSKAKGWFLLGVRL